MKKICLLKLREEDLPFSDEFLPEETSFYFLGACPVFNFVLAWHAKVGCVVWSSRFVRSGVAPLLYL